VASEAVAGGLREIGKGPGPVDALGIRDRAVDIAPATSVPLRPQPAQ
jgi:hypothetical protein